MSINEKVCRNLIAKGQWTKTQCIFCRKINKNKCLVLEEIEDGRLCSKDYQPLQDGFVPDKR